MQMTKAISLILLLLPTIEGFSVFEPKCNPFASVMPTSSSALCASPIDNDKLKQITQEEALNADGLKETAAKMKTMKPEDIDGMLKEMENMPAAQKEQLKSMGMDPEIMMSTMKMMKDNPEMIGKMSEVMESMTPEELMEQSRLAQQNFAFMSPNEDSVTQKSVAAEVVDNSDEAKDDEDEDEEYEPVEPVPETLDAMFRVAQIMSVGEGDGITFQAFVTLPPIALLSGTGEDDLSKKELSDCWNKGSLGASRVDREGFERVWREVQTNYYNDIVEEAQERATMKKRKRGSDKPVTSASPTNLQVGASLSPEQLQATMKNMKDEDLSAMFEQMSNMTPADEARMRSMGVDPAMMKKSAEMIKNNPLLRKAATAMMKNTPPDQLMKASQQAQEKMANMTEEEKKKMMESLK